MKHPFYNFYIYYSAANRIGNYLWIYNTIKSLKVPIGNIYFFIPNKKCNFLSTDLDRVKHLSPSTITMILELCPDAIILTDSYLPLENVVWSVFYRDANELFSNIFNFDYQNIVIGEYFLNIGNIDIEKVDLKCPHKYDTYIRNRYADIINLPNLVTINIRRKDFTEPFYKFCFNLCSIPYYDAIIDSIGRYDHNYIFISDDIEFCKQNFKQSNFYFVEEDGFIKPLIDFYMHQYADTNVLSNSTYCWWAAIPNYKRGAHIISPRVWVNDGIYNSEAVLFPDWDIRENMDFVTYE